MDRGVALSAQFCKRNERYALVNVNMNSIWSVVLIIGLLQSCHGMDWKICDGSTSANSDVKTVTLKPDPPPPGSTLEFEVKGVSSELFTKSKSSICSDFCMHSLRESSSVHQVDQIYGCAYVKSPN